MFKGQKELFKLIWNIFLFPIDILIPFFEITKKKRRKRNTFVKWY